jgi:hypothetical protein
MTWGVMTWHLGRVSLFSGVVAGVLGVVHAFGELRPALVQRGDELHENGGALDDVRAGLSEEGEELLVPRLHP